MTAFFGLILKASSRQCVAPLARCAIGTSTILNTDLFGFESQSRSFSSTVADKKDLVDANLYKALKHEYNSSSDKEILKQSLVNMPVGSFPFKFDYVSLSRRRRMFQLKREFPDGEKVVVRIDFRNIDNIKKLEYSKKYEDEAISIEDNNSPAIPVIVKVEQNDSFFQVKISACTENIIIEGIDNGDDDWPKFEELDDELRQGLKEYLNVRGINRETVLFMLKLVAKESQKADLLALKHFKKVVK